MGCTITMLQWSIFRWFGMRHGNDPCFEEMNKWGTFPWQDCYKLAELVETQKLHPDAPAALRRHYFAKVDVILS